MVQYTVALIASKPLCIFFLSKCTNEVRSGGICFRLVQPRRLTRKKKQHSSQVSRRVKRKLVITSPHAKQMELEF